MLIPWLLVASLVAAAAVGAAVARAQGERVGPVADSVLGVALPALVAARLAIILRDAVLTGGLPPPTAWITITAGLSVPVALLVGLLAGARQLRRASSDGPDPRVAITAVWAGLITFAATSVLRGDVLGIGAPAPLGIPWPGVEGTHVPVGLLEAAVLGLGLWWARRRFGADPARLGASLVSVMAVVHLLGGTLRPSLATPDRDLDTVLGVVVLALAIAAVRGVSRRGLGLGLTAGGAFVGLLTVGLVAGGGTATSLGEGAADMDPTGSLAGALVSGGDPGAAPAWDGAALAAFAAADGGPVVVNLWASWCPPCHAEAPAVARAARALEGEVTFLGVLIDDEQDRAQGFVDRYDLPFPTVVGDGIADAVGSPGLPTTVVLGADGQVLERAVGGVDDRALAAMIDRAGG